MAPHLRHHSSPQLLAPRRRGGRRGPQRGRRGRHLLFQRLLALQQRAQLLPHLLAAGAKVGSEGCSSGAILPALLTSAAAAAAVAVRARLHACIPASPAAELRAVLPAAGRAAIAALPRLLGGAVPRRALVPARLPLLLLCTFQLPAPPLPAFLGRVIAGIDLLLHLAQLLAQRLQAGGQLGALACRASGFSVGLDGCAGLNPACLGCANGVRGGVGDR